MIIVGTGFIYLYLFLRLLTQNESLGCMSEIHSITIKAEESNNPELIRLKEIEEQIIAKLLFVSNTT